MLAGGTACRGRLALQGSGMWARLPACAARWSGRGVIPEVLWGVSGPRSAPFFPVALQLCVQCQSAVLHAGCSQSRDSGIGSSFRGSLQVCNKASKFTTISEEKSVQRLAFFCEDGNFLGSLDAV